MIIDRRHKKLPENLKITEYDFSKESKIKDSLLKKCLSKLNAAKNSPVLEEDNLKYITKTRKLEDDELEMLAAAGTDDHIPHEGTCPDKQRSKCDGCPFYNSGDSDPSDIFNNVIPSWHYCSQGYTKS